MSTPTRGIHHPTHPAVLGTFVGAVGATAFVFINRGNTPDPGPAILLLGWAVTLAFFAYVTLVHPRTLPTPDPPRPKAGVVYVVSVAAMILGLVLAARAMAVLELQALQPAVVAAIVGAHFVPFTYAFRAAVFARFGAGMIACGVLGVVAGLTVRPWYASGAAAVAGLVWLAVMAVDARRDHA